VPHARKDPGPGLVRKLLKRAGLKWRSVAPWRSWPPSSPAPRPGLLMWWMKRRVPCHAF